MNEGTQRVYARPGYFVPFDPDSREPADLFASEFGNHPQSGLNYHQWLVGQIAGPVMAEFLRSGGTADGLHNTAILIHRMARVLANSPFVIEDDGKERTNGTV
jgi:hypothetical protein